MLVLCRHSVTGARDNVLKCIIPIRCQQITISTDVLIKRQADPIKHILKSGAGFIKLLKTIISLTTGFRRCLADQYGTCPC